MQPPNHKYIGELARHIAKRESGFDAYIATPYSHERPDIEEWRFEQVTCFASHLTKMGLNVYSPITHSHPMRKHNDLPGDWEFWQHIDRRILDMCHNMIVFAIPGWQRSTGIKHELEQWGKLYSYIRPVYYDPYVEHDPKESIFFI